MYADGMSDITPTAQESLPTVSIAAAIDRLHATTWLVDLVTEILDVARARQDAAISEALIARAGWKRVEEESGLSTRGVQMARDRARAKQPAERLIARRGGPVDRSLSDSQIEDLLEQLARM